jgi:hypothetical protein
MVLAAVSRTGRIRRAVGGSQNQPAKRRWEPGAVDVSVREERLGISGEEEPSGFPDQSNVG